MNNNDSADFEIMNITPNLLKMLKPVKVLDIYDGGSDNTYH